MILLINHYYEPYFNTPIAIDNISTGRKEEVQLVLFRDIVSTGFGESVAKRPIAKYFDDNEVEIPRRQWTSEMVASAKREIQQNPPPRYRKFTILGKGIFFLAGLLVMFAVAAFVYIYFVSAPKMRTNRTAFVELPTVGDRYYGSLFGQDFMVGGTLKASWVIIESVSAQDSVVQLKLSDEIAAFTFETKDVDHTQFNGASFRTKFSTDGNKVMFKGIGSDFGFESTVYNDKFDAYKISASDE